MAFPLTQPAIGSTNWGASVNQNWSDINASLNLTAGSIPFSAGTSGLTQDNAQLFWDNTNKRLGIGTSNPSNTLTVAGSNDPLMLSSTGSYVRARLKKTGGGTNEWSIFNDSRFAIRDETNDAFGQRLEIDSSGNVTIQQHLQVNNGLDVVGTKNFLIDHPLDPANRLLRHACVEGPEIMNAYKGHGRLRNRAAVIELPSYFDALNAPVGREVVLTCIDGWSPLYVDGPIRDNRFTVRGAQGARQDQEFSWVLLAVRDDPYVRAHPLVVEEDKGAAGSRYPCGSFLRPELHESPPRAEAEMAEVNGL